MRRQALAVAIVVSSMSCARPGAIATLVPPAADQLARAFIDSLRFRPAHAAQQLMMPYQVVDSALTDTIAMAQRIIPAGQPDSVQIVNAFSWTSGETQRAIDYQIHVGGKWVLMRVTEYEDVHGTRFVAGFNIQPLSASLQSLNAFTLHNASTGGLIAAMLALVAILASLYAAVQVMRSPLERRWLWVLVALLGFGKIGVEWHTGTVSQQWIAVQLLGAGYQREGLYGPWWIFFSMPGGAVVALDRRRRAIGAARARSCDLP